MPTLQAGGHRLHYRWIPPGSAGRPPLVFLHEGLGSVELWRDFPDRVAAATGCGALIYSRWGHGGSDPLGEPRGVDFMHREALEVLPEALADRGIENPILIGHSDGGSIALIYAGSGRSVRGLILEAPHVFVEDCTVERIAEAGELFKSSDLRTKLARYHADVNGAFWGWNAIWLRPEFRVWNIEEYLPSITCPTLVIQGQEDEYGTWAQVEAIEREIGGPLTTLRLTHCGHTPHVDQAEATLEAMVKGIVASR
jgi:pimeloyl-ACP methyl ester carboxylesterase